MNNMFAAALGVLALILVALYAFTTQVPPSPVACTMEAKICPDGTAVGRTGPKCEFEACPSEALPGGETGLCEGGTCPSVGPTGTLEVRVNIGPVCPVEQEGVPCPPTPEMFAARPLFIYRANRTLVTTITANAEGVARATLPEGDYWVDMEQQPIGGITGVPTTTRINAGTTTTLTIDVDTGIR